MFLVLLAYRDRLLRLPWIGKYPSLIAADLRRMFTKDPMTLVVVLLAIAGHVLSVLMIFSLARALAASISFFQALVIVPPVLLISALPISAWWVGRARGGAGRGICHDRREQRGRGRRIILFGLSGPLIGAISELAMLLVRTRDATPKDAA